MDQEYQDQEIDYSGAKRAKSCLLVGTGTSGSVGTLVAAINAAIHSSSGGGAGGTLITGGVLTGAALLALLTRKTETYSGLEKYIPQMSPKVRSIMANVGRRMTGREPIQEEEITAVETQPEPREAIEELQPRPAAALPKPQPEPEKPATETLELPGKCNFSDFLASGWRPSWDQILIGFLPGGLPVFVEAQKLCHVAIAGPTGHGKTSLLRLLEAQLCYIGAKVLHLDPHWTIFDVEQNEDWSPYIKKYTRDPFQCSQYENIDFYLSNIVDVILPARKERRAHGESPGVPYFVAITESPVVKDNTQFFERCMKTMLNEGRKFRLNLISESQDFLGKTLFEKTGTAIRECYHTVFYTGGDLQTGKKLLDIPASEIPESKLGKGLVMVRCAAVPEAKLLRVPYLDNRGLYMLLGPSTYVPPKESRFQTSGLGYPPGYEPQEQPEPPYRPLQRVRTGVTRQETARPSRPQRARHFYPAQPPRPAPQEPGRKSQIDGELERGVQAVKAGGTSLDKFAAILGQKPSSVRALYARVKLFLESQQPEKSESK